MGEVDIVTLFVQVHNAAVIFHHRGETVTFSSFVVVPPDTSDGSRCSYPATAASISTKIFCLQNFLEQLTTLLTSLSASQLPNAKNAIYITEFLTSLLRGIGEGVSLDAHDGGLILKQTANEKVRPRPRLSKKGSELSPGPYLTPGDLKQLQN